MSNTVLRHVSKDEAGARRLEIFTGAGRRRKWSSDEKAAIIAESYGSGDTVCAVARRHGLTHSQLFAWRREARRCLANDETPTSLFVPAVVEAPSPAKSRELGSGTIEVALGSVTVRVGRGAEAKMVAAVIRALKAGA